jgi:hypothetical protein
MIKLTWRHLCRHWRLNVAVLLCLTLACALVASMSSYAGAIAARELSQTLDAASPSQRSLLITGTRYSFTDELYSSLQEKLGDILKDRIVIRHATLTADAQPSTEGRGNKHAVALLDVYSFDQLSENVHVVKGKLPDQVRLFENAEPWRPPPIEAVIGVRASEQSGYTIGDQLIASGKYQRLDIVGIVEPRDQHADVWGGDLSAFDTITNTGDLGKDGNALPLVIEPHSMQSYYPLRPIFPYEESWRITLNPQLIHADRVETLHSDLINFQTQSATVHATMSTGLVQLLVDYLARVSRVRLALLLLTVQTLIFVLYALVMFSSFVLDRSQVELATLSGRGASAWQVTRIFALENLVLTCMAVLSSPLLALGAIRLWAGSIGETVSILLPGEVWLLSSLVAVLGFLALVLPVFLATRRNVLGWQRLHARPPRQSATQQRYLDLYLLVFGGLLYWQLNQTDSFVMSRLGNTFVADPLLLIGPSLLLIGVAMLFLRVLPYLLQIVAWLVQNLRGLTLSQGLLHLSRDSQQSSQLVLLVSLTAGLVLFTQTLANSLVGSPEAIAQYLAGALQLNALALVLFSVTMFFLAHLFATQGRAGELGILRALGLSSRQSLSLLMLEGVIVLSLGLIIGAVVGLGLSRIMNPYLAQALSGGQLGITIEQASISWTVITQTYVLLIAIYGLALTILGVILVRTREHWAIWMEDE